MMGDGNIMAMATAGHPTAANRRRRHFEFGILMALITYGTWHLSLIFDGGENGGKQSVAIVIEMWRICFGGGKKLAVHRQAKSKHQ